MKTSIVAALTVRKKEVMKSADAVMLSIIEYLQSKVAALEFEIALLQEQEKEHPYASHGNPATARRTARTPLQSMRKKEANTTLLV